MSKGNKFNSGRDGRIGRTSRKDRRTTVGSKSRISSPKKQLAESEEYTAHLENLCWNKNPKNVDDLFNIFEDLGPIIVAFNQYLAEQEESKNQNYREVKTPQNLDLRKIRNAYQVGIRKGASLIEKFATKVVNDLIPILMMATASRLIMTALENPEVQGKLVSAAAGGVANQLKGRGFGTGAVAGLSAAIMHDNVTPAAAKETKKSRTGKRKGKSDLVQKKDKDVPSFFDSNGMMRSIDEFDDLLEAGSDINERYSNDISLLESACRNGDLVFVKRLLKLGAETNGAKSGFDAIYHAVDFGREAIVRELLDFGVGIEGVTGLTTPLNLAYIRYNGERRNIRGGGTVSIEANREVIKILLTYGANLDFPVVMPKVMGVHITIVTTRNSLEEYGVTNFLEDLQAEVEKDRSYLWGALEEGDVGAVDKLLNRGVSPEIVRGKVRKDFPLFYASSLGDSDMVNVLIKKGANVERGTALERFTSLFIAVAKGHSGVVRILIDAGANVNAEVKGETMLEVAKRSGNSDIIKILEEEIERGKEDRPMNDKLKEGIFRSDLNLVKEAFLEGANIEARVTGWTPLLLATHRDREDGILEYLIQKGADINAKIEGGSETALIRTIENGQIKNFRVLIESGVEIEVDKGSKDLSPLMIAVRNGEIEMIETLIEKGANINGQYFLLGRTPLTEAAKRGDVMAFEILLNAGADLNIVNKRGVRVADEIRSYGKKEITSLLDKIDLEVEEVVSIDVADVAESLTVSSSKSQENSPVDSDSGSAGKIDFALDSEVVRDLKTFFMQDNIVGFKSLVKESQFNIDQVIDDNGLSFTHLAVLLEKTEFLSGLQDLGADLNKVGNKGRTLALYAVLNEKIKSLRALKDLGVDFAIEIDGLSLTTYAVLKEKIKSLRALKDLGVDFTIEIGGINLITYAVSNEKIESLRALKDLGYDLDKPDSKGITPIFYSLSSREMESLKVLIELDVDLDKENIDGITPIQYAVHKARTHVVKLLIEGGSSIDKSSNGDNPLLVAINGYKTEAKNDKKKKRYKKIIKQLVLAGANINFVDENIKKSPLEVAGEVDGLKEFIEGLVIKRDEKNQKKQSQHDEETLKQLKIFLNEGDIASFKSMLKRENFDINQVVDDRGNTFVHFAVTVVSLTNDPAFLIALGDLDADFNNPGHHGLTPLIVAVDLGTVDIIKTMVRLGATIDKPSSAGFTPLMYSINKGTDMMIALLKSEANLDKPSGKGLTPVIVAIAEGRIEHLKILKEYGADFSKADAGGKTPSKYAEEREEAEYLEIVKSAIKETSSSAKLQRAKDKSQKAEGRDDGVALPEEDKSDSRAQQQAQHDEETLKQLQTFLYEADIASFKSMVKRENFDINQAVKDGYSFVHHAATLQNGPDFLMSLKELGADFNNPGTLNGVTPLMIAIIQGKTDMMEALKELGADFNKIDSHGYTPLIRAVITGKADIVETIIRLGATIDKGSNTGNTPLLHSIMQEGTDVMIALLKLEADIDQPNDLGKTPVILAIEEGKIEHLKILKEYGADFSKPDAGGKTPSKYAEEREEAEYLEIVKSAIKESSNSQKLQRAKGKNQKEEKNSGNFNYAGIGLGLAALAGGAALLAKKNRRGGRAEENKGERKEEEKMRGLESRESEAVELNDNKEEKDNKKGKDKKAIKSKKAIKRKRKKEAKKEKAEDAVKHSEIEPLFAGSGKWKDFLFDKKGGVNAIFYQSNATKFIQYFATSYDDNADFTDIAKRLAEKDIDDEALIEMSSNLENSKFKNDKVLVLGDLFTNVIPSYISMLPQDKTGAVAENEKEKLGKTLLKFLKLLREEGRKINAAERGNSETKDFAFPIPDFFKDSNLPRDGGSKPSAAPKKPEKVTANPDRPAPKFFQAPSGNGGGGNDGYGPAR